MTPQQYKWNYSLVPKVLVLTPQQTQKCLLGFTINEVNEENLQFTNAFIFLKIIDLTERFQTKIHDIWSSSYLAFSFSQFSIEKALKSLGVDKLKKPG